MLYVVVICEASWKKLRAPESRRQIASCVYLQRFEGYVATHVKSNLQLGTISSCWMRATTRFTWAIGSRSRSLQRRSRSLQRLEARTDSWKDDPAEWGKGGWERGTC